MTTTTVYSDAADGRISSSNATYATARAGLGTLVATTNEADTALVGQFTNGVTVQLDEWFLSFDTSGIPDADPVSASTISIYGSEDSSTTDFTIEIRSRDWGATLTTADWVAGADLSGLTLLASFATSAGWSTSAYNDFTSESAFASNINKTGSTRVLGCSSRQTSNTPPVNGVGEHVRAYFAEQTGTTQDPKLVVVHGVIATANTRRLLMGIG